MRNLLITTAIALALITPAHALTLTPDLCGIHGDDGVWNNITEADTKRISKYCDARARKAIASDPGSYVLGRIEKAEAVQGDPKSKHYYWIKSLDAEFSNPYYFDDRSDIGKKILRVCIVNSVCALKIDGRKSWELNVDHATFWVAKVIEGKRMGAR